MIKVVFSHGKKGSPNNAKMSYLINIAKDLDFKTESIDYTSTTDPEQRVVILKNYLKHDSYDGEYILVGSSMGGYVSLVATQSITPKGCFLLCPSLYLPNYANQTFTLTKSTEIVIVHGKFDNIVPSENSIQFARKTSCELHLVDTDHSMMNALETVGQLFRTFLLRKKRY